VRSRSTGSSFIYLLIIVAAAFLIYSFYSQQMEDITNLPLTQVAAKIRANEVESIHVEGNTLSITLTDGDEIESHKGHESTVTEQLRDLGITTEQLANVEINVVQPPDWVTWLSAGGSILLVLAMFGIGYFVLRQFQGANNQALATGARLLSVYHSETGLKFWIITEADRSVTTVLLPEDY